MNPSTPIQQVALPFRAYRGEDTHIFVSYAHADMAVVYPHLTWLHDGGVNVWYDEGIQVGSIWREELALAVESSCRLVFFASGASVESHYCRAEISFAADLGIPITVVQVEDVPLPGIVRMAEDLKIFSVEHEAWREQLLELLDSDNATDGENRIVGPSIAVLPFSAHGGGEETAQMADAVTDDITTALSSTPEFFVIAHNSSAAYREGPLDAQQIGAQLGVRYLVTGSLRQGGNRIRVTVELMQSSSAEVLWKERFDLAAEDLFAASDDVIEAVCAQLQNPLQATESRRAERHAPEDLDAWLLTQRAKQIYFVSGNDPQHIAEAEALLELAIEKDPKYAHALAFSANVKTISILFGYSQDPEQDRMLALKRGRLALDIAPADPAVLGNLGNVMAFAEGPESAIPLYEAAIARDPNNPHHRANLGFNLYRVRRTDEGRAHIHRAFRLSPKDPRLYMWHFYLGGMSDDPKQALEEFDRSIALFDRYLASWQGKIIALGRLGRWQEAQAVAAAMRATIPEVGLERFWSLLQIGLEGDTTLERDYRAILEVVFADA